MFRCRRLWLFVAFPRIGFGRKRDVSLSFQIRSPHCSFCNVGLLFWRSLHGRMTELSWLAPQLPRCGGARRVCGPSPALSKPPASPGFVYTSERLPNMQAAGLKCERIGCWLHSHMQAGLLVTCGGSLQGAAAFEPPHVSTLDSRVGWAGALAAHTPPPLPERRGPDRR